MKISILVSDLSSHCLVRTYPIAKVLERHYEVEVIGPVFGNGIYEPYRDEFHYSPFPFNASGGRISRIANGLHQAREMWKYINGDMIYAFKPTVMSFGIGLLAKCTKKIPLILDIEDWEAEAYYRASGIEKLYALGKLHNPNNDLYRRAMEPLTKLADRITVVSDFLQNRYGGVRLPHGTDCRYFDPTRYSREDLRRKWGFSSSSELILFAGTSMPHKGLEDVLTALTAIGSRSIQLVTVGTQTEHLKRLKELGGDSMICIGPQPHSRMPEFLKVADLVVLPQRRTAVAEAQVPGKVFEAMAMAKPIIATAISDLPDILDSCGWIVEPENPKQLAEVIRYVLDHADEAEEMGWRAREKCLTTYSWEAMETILAEVLSAYA